MTNKRIKELAGFFYSSNNSNDVPLRLAITTGQFLGFDLQKEDFIELLILLRKSKNLKIDLKEFLTEQIYEQE